jgi:hypothetical protein
VRFWRGFFVYAAVSIAPPIVLTLLSMTIGAIAMLYGYTIAPALIYAYPVSLLMPNGGVAALWLAALLALACCAVFGYVTRRRDTGEQWILSIAAFAGWWIVWRLVCLAANIHPHLDVRM